MTRNTGKSKKTAIAPSFFAEEVDRFTSHYRLSRREKDIIVSLVKNITNSEDIAKSLGISTHTVNNHLKSIFEKTSTRSKTEILSIFLRFAADQMQTRNLFMRKPRVLVIDDEEMICEFVVHGLIDRGMKAYGLTEPTKAIDAISTLNIDFVVCDVRMPTMSGMSLLKRLRQTYRCWPYFIFITGYPEDYSLEEGLHSGAAGFIEKPIDLDRLFRMIMEHLVETNEEKAELLQVGNQSPIVIESVYSLTPQELGCGGAFVPMDSQFQKEQGLVVGSLMDLKLSPIQSRHVLKVRGQIVWKRSSKPDNQRPAGIGVKFVDMSDTDRAFLEDYIRSNDICSFIPLGGEDPQPIAQQG